MSNNQNYHTTDDLELAIIDILQQKNISFIHESNNKFPAKGNRKLDFYIPDYNVYIEVKGNHTDRLYAQIKEYENEANIIIIIGCAGIRFLQQLLK